MTTLGVGHYSAEDIHTVLGPAIAFLSKARMPRPLPEDWIPVMPDLAVEIGAPGETLGHLRQKAVAYLSRGASLVWTVLPSQRGVDVCRSASGARLDIEFVGADGVLSGEEALPGFELALSRLFPRSSNFVLKGESPSRPYNLSQFNPISQPLRVSNRRVSSQV